LHEQKQKCPTLASKVEEVRHQSKEREKKKRRGQKRQLQPNKLFENKNVFGSELFFSRDEKPNHKLTYTEPFQQKKNH